MVHALLERQLRKTGLRADALPADPDLWAALLEHISRVYTQNEQDRYLLERSLSLASEEMQEEITERKRVEEALWQMHKDLDHQNRQLERTHELLRSAVERMINLVARGATTDELISDLRIVQTEFERLDTPKSNGHST